MITRLARATDIARESGVSVEEIRQRVERGDSEGFLLDDELLVPEDYLASGRDDPGGIAWLQRWAKDAGLDDDAAAG